ncbi:peptidase M61 domain protein [Chloroherpeton thalassium ATCC 35110]|uniref:Peptidase M61 domain protein n=1 Tax=Chloroherpeton thalassium (strain ATCC 35110 / GB-78) TaxID=517418 RepID=B3QSH9_CHLT3|nr:PDZ domain-containing protein [Chloroherpeton thalassium]ACF12570.1 peptidase M61 domain protein [Chloroherpeton thalassium ATCC 35110]
MNKGRDFFRVKAELFAFFAILMFFASGCQSSAPSTASVQPSPAARVLYQVDATDTTHGLYRVSLSVENLSLPHEIKFSMPSWAPGAYEFFQFGKYVQNLRAITTSGDEIFPTEIETGSWLFQDADEIKSICYSVAETQSSQLFWPEKTILNGRYGYANSTNVFGYIWGLKALPCQVIFSVPDSFQVASPLETSPNSKICLAKNYDELVDSPFILGKYERHDFFVQGKPHSLILLIDSTVKRDPSLEIVNSIFDKNELYKKRFSFRADSLLAVTKEIVQAHYNFYKELPYEKYIFIHHLTPMRYSEMYGALEHRQASAYHLPLFNWEKARQHQITSTVSHEFFHVWNPKKIFSDRLTAFDYQAKCHTKNMWFVEGVTDYYADLLLVKSGVIPKELFFANLLQRYQYWELDKDDYDANLEKLSLEIASIESLDEILPLYVKGTLVAMMLDVELRLQTKNRFGLDSLMLTMNKIYGNTGKAFQDDSLMTIINRLSGADVSAFYEKYISGTAPIPFDKYLYKAGLLLNRSVSEKPFMGFSASPDSAGAFFADYVSEGSTAQEIGLKPDDIILSINQVKAENSADFLRQFLSAEVYQNKKDISVTVLRKGMSKVLKGKIVWRKAIDDAIVPFPDPIKSQKDIYKSILSLP